MRQEEYFPDGTRIHDWFYEGTPPRLEDLGTPYVLTQHGIADDGKLYTKQIQELIDRIHEAGGGVVVVPAGTYRTGALFFKPGVHLYLSTDAILLGSDDIADYPIVKTRIEGETCMYFAALINADSTRGFTLCGDGVIDGNGLRSWKAFWLRRKWNGNCTNKDEQRPRLLYVSNSSDVTISGVTLRNSHFWTTHIYKCDYVRYMNCSIFAPRSPVHAPSSDAIDIDACSYVHIKNCRMEVADDGVVLKGGKGPWADTDENNGMNENILIEDCEMIACDAALTCGSESIRNRNVILRRCQVSRLQSIFHLKLRPDTPQFYEHIRVENVSGSCQFFVTARPWTQFYDLKDRKDTPMSYADQITIRNCSVICHTFLNMSFSKEYDQITNFSLENLHIQAHIYKAEGCPEEDLILHNVFVEAVAPDAWKNKKEAI